MTSQQKIKYCYGSFAIAVILSMIPQTTIQTFAMVFSLIVLIVLYVVRSKTPQETFEYTEMNELIKTYWVWTALYVVGLFVAGALISTYGDMTVIDQWTESIVQGGMAPDKAELERVTHEFMTVNFTLIVSMTVACVLPSAIYAFVRSKKGISRINNPPVPPIDPIII